MVFSNMRKLQAIKNIAASKVSTGTKKFDYVAPVLKEFRKIPVQTNFVFRKTIFASKYTLGMLPRYLSSSFISRESVSGRVKRNLHN